jgi:transcription elongation GreA/GreB family factor
MAFAKSGLKEALLRLEDLSIEQASAALRANFQAARLNLDDIEDDQDQSQQRQAAEMADALWPRVHEHETHRRILEELPFGPRERVEPGAVVRVEGRYLVIAVPTPAFVFGGVQLVGVSPDTPLAHAMAGLAAGDTFSFRGRDLKVEEIH